LYGYFNSRAVIYRWNSKSFFTKMISVKSSTNLKRTKIFCESFMFSGSLPAKGSKYTTKIWNFPYFYSTFSSYEWPSYMPRSHFWRAFIWYKIYYGCYSELWSYPPGIILFPTLYIWYLNSLFFQLRMNIVWNNKLTFIIWLIYLRFKCLFRSVI
jgi:hypothetical protein